MFYHNLGGTLFNNLTGNHGPFTNIQSDYWSGTELYTFSAWDFLFVNGGQGNDFKDVNFAAWAVRPGDVSAVPEPSTVLLLSSGLGGLALRRRILRRRRR